MEELARWLLVEGRQKESMLALVEGFAEQLAERMALDRMWVGTTVLHPQTAAYIWTWTRGVVRELSIDYERFARMEQYDSPIRRLKHGDPEGHFRAPETEGMSTLEDLWAEGYVEMFSFPFHFRRRWVGALTWSSRKGFTPEQVQLLRQVTPLFSAVMEPLAADLVTHVLLRTYLGQDAGDRVFHGEVQRGDGETLRAVVWFSDVRGFTAMSEVLERDALLQVLNSSFELVVGAVEAHGGQVLKFMGDGVLAVFPCLDGDEAACGAALEAARRLVAGLGPVRMGVGLHLGSVSYGNIGSPSRLDFTVIGPAVNLAARVESQCGRLGHPVLATAEVAAHGGWVEVGPASLKGVADAVTLFRPE